MTTNFTSPAVAALLAHATAPQGSPFALSMAGDSWLPTHNSIAANVPAVAQTAGVVSPTRVRYGTAKQAAPPRGELR